MLPPVLHQDMPEWDRRGDLERVRSTYAAYDRVGRKRLWDTRNRGYARLLSELRERLVRELARSLPKGGGRVLDLGCGTGDLAAEAARRGLRPDWVGVDLRPAAVEIARARYPHATFHVASADEVPEPDASFDVIVAQLLFSSLPSPQLERAVVVEMERLLRPAGWLVWSDLRYGNPANPDVHGIGERRLAELFAGWHAKVRPVGLIPPLARYLGPATPLLYPLFSSLRPLRAHLIGRLGSPADRSA